MTVVDGALYPRQAPRTTWAALDEEVPRLSGWVTEHGAAVADLAQRLLTGARRRIEAMESGDDRLLSAVDARITELRAQVAELDYGARRLLAIRVLFALRDVVGDCDVSVRSADGQVAIDVREG